MKRNIFTLGAMAAAVMVGGVMPAAAQDRDCLADSLLVVEGISRGTQRVPRDPRIDTSNLETVAVAVRNISAGAVTFTVGFSAPPVQTSFVIGQTWTLPPGQRTSIDLANVLKPMADALVMSALKLTCP